MIDIQSIGIRRVSRIQKEKFFPMPDYDLSKFNQVKVTVYERVLNDEYTKILFEHPEFDIETVYLIDQVQKGKHINNDAVKYLCRLKVIEGRQPNIYVSYKIAKIIDQKADYIKHKAFNDSYYQELIIQYLKDFEEASRDDIRKLLYEKLSDVLNDEQKERLKIYCKF